MDCLFCKIVKKELPSEIVHETDEVLVFKDIHPKAPVHLLIVPKMEKKHVASVNDLEEADEEMVAGMFFAAKKVARELGLDKSGYKLLFNVGRGGGQLIDHLHLHLLGGWGVGEERQMP